MFSQKNCNPKPKSPFYYMVHPHEAYIRGHTIHLGSVHEHNSEFQAYNYYLPMDTARLVPVINDYFHALIKESEARGLHPERMRKRSFLCSIDTAIGTLSRLDFLIKQGEPIVIGSTHLRPMTWAIFGTDRPHVQCYKHWFYHAYALIDHYTKRYEEQCHCYPVCLYHGQVGRTALTELMLGSGKKNILSANVVMTAAIHFLADMIEHGGPDVEPFFDLFTNDMGVTPDSVDTQVWLKARDRALNGVGTRKFAEKRIGFPAKPEQGPPPPPPRPLRIKVIVTEDRGDTLTTPNTKVTRFLSITKYDPDEQYRYGGC